MPALKQLGMEGGPPLSYLEFELPYLLHDPASSPAT